MTQNSWMYFNSVQLCLWQMRSWRRCKKGLMVLKKSGDANNDLCCWCCVRMDYPCRHVFAVAVAFSIKVSMSSINTRFYLNQETVGFTKESPRAFEFMMRFEETKKVSYMCPKPECFRDVSTNDRAVAERGFKEALVRNGIAKCYEASSETVVLPQCEQHPEQALSSSTPTIEEEIKFIDKIDNDSDTTKEAIETAEETATTKKVRGRKRVVYSKGIVLLKWSHSKGNQLHVKAKKKKGTQVMCRFMIRLPQM